MFEYFKRPNSSLRRAGWLLLIEIVGGVMMALVLQESGFMPELVIPAVWLVNLFTASYLSMAAAELRKNQWVYGLASALGPPLALILYGQLKSADTLRRLDASH